MVDSVYEALENGQCIGIFPEVINLINDLQGGSHDRTDILPLKAGIGIMALGAMAKFKDCKVKIIPCGLNYFKGH